MDIRDHARHRTEEQDCGGWYSAWVYYPTAPRYMRNDNNRIPPYLQLRSVLQWNVMLVGAAKTLGSVYQSMSGGISRNRRLIIQDQRHRWVPKSRLMLEPRQDRHCGEKGDWERTTKQWRPFIVDWFGVKGFSFGARRVWRKTHIVQIGRSDEFKIEGYLRCAIQCNVVIMSR